MAITVKDVAKKAGVATSTVPRSSMTIQASQRQPKRKYKKSWMN